MRQPFSTTELQRRRAGARRFGWLLGAVALLIYLVGLFVKR